MDALFLSNSIKIADNSHVLVIGACRTGKTQDFVKSNLLKISDSVIVFGRNNDGILEDTVAFRRDKLNQRICKINTPSNFYELIGLNDVNVTSDTPGHKDKIAEFFKSGLSLYILEPVVHGREGNYFIVNLLLETMLYAYSEEKAGGGLYPITVFFDDISLFHIDEGILLKCLTKGRENNIRIIITAQDINHLERQYGKETTQKILNNCSIALR